MIKLVSIAKIVYKSLIPMFSKEINIYHPSARLDNYKKVTFIRIMHKEFVKQFMLQGHSFHRSVGNDVIMCYIIQPGNSIKAPTGFLVTKKCYCLCLSSLQTIIL